MGSFRAGLSTLGLSLLLNACAPPPETAVVPPVPRAPVPAPMKGTPKTGKLPAPAGEAPLAPLATPQQVIRSVDLGRSDPFAAVLTPLRQEFKEPTSLKPSSRAAAGPPRLASWMTQPLPAPEGLEFQGVLAGPLGVEALVEYTPSNNQQAGVRSGSLRVGDTGSDQETSLLPPGWRVQSIDISDGVLVLQKDGRKVSLTL